MSAAMLGPVPDQLQSFWSWDPQARGEPGEEVLRAPVLQTFFFLLFSTGCGASLSHSTEGAVLRATQSNLLAPHVVFLHEHSLEINTPWQVDHTAKLRTDRKGPACSSSERCLQTYSWYLLKPPPGRGLMGCWFLLKPPPRRSFPFSSCLQTPS